MEQIILTDYIDRKLKELIEILYQKEYFGFKSSSVNYVNKIYDFISNISSKRKYNCKNTKYEKKYVILKMNSTTTYFITFDFEGDLFIVKNIFNNHEMGYSNYIKD